jgi:hypothetical protein
MADAFEILAHDHAEVKQMLTQLALGAVRQGVADAEQLKTTGPVAAAGADKARDAITHHGTD